MLIVDVAVVVIFLSNSFLAIFAFSMVDVGVVIAGISG